MSDDARAAREPSLRASLLQHAGGAVIVVGLVTGLFWAIGAASEPDGQVATVTETPEPEEPADDTAAPEPPSTDDDAEEPAPEPDDLEEADDGVEDEAVEDDDADHAADGDAAEEDDAADDGDVEETDDGDTGDAGEPDEETPPAIDPATITVQVLDGYQADGGAAANRVADQLREAGYDLIAQNPALRYDVTTVLWTAGHEAEARQVQAEIGAPEARQQSGNLSTSVAVHIVVGSDRG